MKGWTERQETQFRALQEQRTTAMAALDAEISLLGQKVGSSQGHVNLRNLIIDHGQTLIDFLSLHYTPRPQAVEAPFPANINGAVPGPLLEPIPAQRVDAFTKS